MKDSKPDLYFLQLDPTELLFRYRIVNEKISEMRHKDQHVRQPRHKLESPIIRDPKECGLNLQILDMIHLDSIDAPAKDANSY